MYMTQDRDVDIRISDGKVIVEVTKDGKPVFILTRTDKCELPLEMSAMGNVNISINASVVEYLVNE